MLGSGIIIIILCIFRPVYFQCTKISSQKLGDLEVIDNDEVNKGCVSGFLFRQKKSNRIFCLKEEGGNEVFTCMKGTKKNGELGDCFCGVSNEENLEETKNGNLEEIFHGEYVKKNEYPWMAAIYVEKQIVCGGALITDQVVITAAHCMTEERKRKYMVGLGMHYFKDLWQFKKNPDTFNFDGKNKGVVIRKIKEFQKHPEYNKTIRFEFAIIVLKSKVELSPQIRTVCLPNPSDTFDGAENLITGFGTQILWYQEYERLMKKKIKGAQLIPQTLRLDRKKLLEALSDKSYQQQIIDEFHRAFIEVFPGIEECIDEQFSFTCTSFGPGRVNKITSLIRKKLDKNADKVAVKNFIGWTRNNIVKIELASVLDIDKLSKIKPAEDMMKDSYFNDIYWNSTESYKSALLEKTSDFSKEWAFIGKNIKVREIIYDVTIPDTGFELKRARGKFISKQDCLEIFPKAIEACSRVVDSSILLQRSSIEEGYTCAGDSGGPIVVKQNGHYVLAAVVSRGPYLGRYNWPPECACDCNEYPEEDGRVTAALPWLYQFLKERNLEIACNPK